MRNLILGACSASHLNTWAVLPQPRCTATATATHGDLTECMSKVIYLEVQMNYQVTLNAMRWTLDLPPLQLSSQGLRVVLECHPI